VQSPAPTSLSADQLESLAWHAYINLKLSKLRDVLDEADGSDSHVVNFYRAKVRALIDWISPIEFVVVDIATRRSILRHLDILALHMRFYESALRQQHIPHAVISHTAELFGKLEWDALLLLRPQNQQTFETRPTSLDSHLETLAKGMLVPELSLSAFRRELKSIPDIFVVSYPKYLADTFLAYPVIGHEIGHVLWQRKCSTTIIADLIKRLPGIDATDASRRTLAEQWATEFFCDRIGLHLYGEPYIFALWLLLLTYDEAPSLPPFVAYVSAQSMNPEHLFTVLGPMFADARDALSAGASAETTLDDVARRTLALLQHATAAQPRDPEQARRYDDHLSHPAAGRRLAALVALTVDTTQIDSERFSTWRAGLFERFRSYASTTPEDYAEIEALAEQLAQGAYERIRRTLPVPVESHGREALMQPLLQKLRQWIPPCEVGGDVGALRPAEWNDMLYAGWIVFVETLESQHGNVHDTRALLKFVHQSLDMNILYANYRTIAAALG
jgi:hypothetical protein